MSFETFSYVLKEISSSSSTFLSIRSLIEEHFFHHHHSSFEQEKLVRLCLRKLSEWFIQTPDQMKQIKIDFHTYLLRTPSALTQKQILDLLLTELQAAPSDYLLFLLVDIFDKNYSQLLNELAQELDAGYAIHLPDRVVNVCMTNVPLCFQIQPYFHRLSVYIQKELITRHYPNMIAQIDTNVEFLCQLVHRAAKLGYTEYIWGPIYKQLFLKQQSSNDFLWLRLAQRFLFSTLDDVLLYSIQHGNASILHWLIGDHILHFIPLEIYLTDTLLFRKQQSMAIVRTILIYLTMSSSRQERYFRTVFHRFLQLWSQPSFIRFASNAQHLYICQCICICLAIDRTPSESIDVDKTIMIVLDGIRIHLESTLDYIRRRGQILGELIVKQGNLFVQSSSKNELKFNNYDENHPEVQMLKKLAEKNETIQDRELIDEEKVEEIELPSNVAPSPSIPVEKTTSIVVLHEASADDDDDDSEFEPFDCSHDTMKSDLKRPTYIRACLADLIATEKIDQLEGALHVLPSLIEMHKVECEEIALEIARILLNYNSTFNIDNFEQLQLNGLVVLCVNYPVFIADYLCPQFYERNYTISQRMLILKTIQQATKQLSQIDIVRTKIEKEDDDDDDESETDWRSIVNRRLKLKTKRRVTRKSTRILKENHFGTIVGHFFYPLMIHIDRSSAHLTLINGDNDHLLLCELLACLGRLCIHAQNTPVVLHMIKQLFQVLHSLQQHIDAGVRHAIVYAYACCLVSIGTSCNDDDLQTTLIELKQWLDTTVAKDTNTEVQKLARSVRQILLKTLMEMSDS